MQKDNIQERVRRAYQSGWDAGLKRGKEGEKFPDGVDWHIIAVDCDCGQEQLPTADNAGEDINLYEQLEELKRDNKEKCSGCGKHKKIFFIDGNMASKKEGWKPKEN